MRNLYVGRSKAWLEEQLAAAQDDKAKGVVLTGGGAGEQNFTQEAQGGISVDARIADLLYALYSIDPVTYPARDCAPARRTQAVFYRLPL